MEEKKNEINVDEIRKLLWSKRKLFYKVWAITFALSCIWIFPQPRYYTADISLAPEANGESTSTLAGIASSFGIDIGMGGSVDALYPSLYPDLMESNDFIARIMPIQVTTFDSTLVTDYYTYLKKYQKKNALLVPFYFLSEKISNIIGNENKTSATNSKNLNPFILSKQEKDLFDLAKNKIKCLVDKKTDVIKISVTDQDKLICATMADSICQQLQNSIILYRTKKANADVLHYQALADSAYIEYQSATNEYARFCDAYQGRVLETIQIKRDRLEEKMQLKYTTYQTLVVQLENAKARLQERTPAFTILSGSSVPVKPSGPKRMQFVFGMLFLVTIILLPKALGQDVFMAILRKIV